MPTFKITLAYDGTDFVGWQRQASGTSIQALLEDVLRQLDARAVTVVGAGRTDAGVHALGQVASFALERAIAGSVLVRALNARLPETIRVWSACEVPSSFHARFDARAKSYRYRICNGPIISPFDRQYAWHVMGRLDVDAMSAAARRLGGRHDFAAFQGAGSDVATTERAITVSRLSIAKDAEDAEGQSCLDERSGPDRAFLSGSTLPIVDDVENAERRIKRPANAFARRDTGFDLRVPHVHGGGEFRRVPGIPGVGACLSYEITGDGFLRHMVRNIVGTLVEIGLGRRTPEWIDAVLASHDRSAAGPTAPARGLFLVAVDYGALAAQP